MHRAASSRPAFGGRFISHRFISRFKALDLWWHALFLALAGALYVRLCNNTSSRQLSALPVRKLATAMAID